MSLSRDYRGCDPDSVARLSHDELIDAVNRMLEVPAVPFRPFDAFSGFWLNPDDLADAFRGRGIYG